MACHRCVMGTYGVIAASAEITSIWRPPAKNSGSLCNGRHNAGPAHWHAVDCAGSHRDLYKFCRIPAFPGMARCRRVPSVTGKRLAGMRGARSHRLGLAGRGCPDDQPFYGPGKRVRPTDSATTAVAPCAACSRSVAESSLHSWTA